MSGYDIEHGIPPPSTTNTASDSTSSRRPDLSTYYSTLREVDPSTSPGGIPPTNPHAQPLPENVTAVYRLLAEALQSMTSTLSPTTDTTLQESLITSLLQNAYHPPPTVQGMPAEFFDNLERVPKSKLKKEWDCPICGQAFLDDPYPLVVVLPCHGEHRFDLDCIRPWLLINTTCPMDRKELGRRKEVVKAKAGDEGEEEEEEEYDGFYG